MVESLALQAKEDRAFFQMEIKEDRQKFEKDIKDLQIGQSKITTGAALVVVGLSILFILSEYLEQFNLISPPIDVI